MKASGPISNQIRHILRGELERRCKKNPSYSLRSFAKSIGIDQSFLTKVLNGKRDMSSKRAAQVGERLGLSIKRLQALSKVERDLQTYRKLDELDFEILSDWLHFAILELMLIPGFRYDFNWISKRLKVSAHLIRPAIRRLIERGLIEEKGDRISLSSPNNDWTNTDKTTQARRVLQKQLLAKAITAINEVAFERREASSLTIACDPALLPEVKVKILEFKEELRAFIEKQGREKEVYQLCLAFFPLSQQERL